MIYIKTYSIGLNPTLGEALEEIRKSNHPISTLNRFVNYLLAELVLKDFANDLSKKQINKLKELIK